MSIRVRILFMLGATLLAWICWSLVITNINPFDTAWWGFALFYATFFLGLFGTFTIFGYVIRTVFALKRMTTGFKITTALRQSFLWSLALTIALGLQAERILAWWSFLLLLFVFILIEIIVLSIAHRNELHE